MKIDGIISAMVTPFDQNEAIDYPATEKLIDYLIENGVHGIFILGTNGEFHTLSWQEKLDFADFVIKYIDHRVPVFVGTGGNSTREVIALSQEMKRLGADCLSVITPYFIPVSQREVEAYFRDIAANVELPLIMYNIPSKTGMTLDPATVARLADVTNIIGIKDSSGQFKNIQAYIDVTKDKDFAVLAGTDSLILKGLTHGAKGAIAATSNMLPDIAVAIYTNWKKGDLEQAEKAQAALQPLRDTFKLGTIPAVLKQAVNLYGVQVGVARRPVLMPDEAANQKIQAMVDFYRNSK